MKIIDKALNLIFPPKCYGCDELLPYYKTDALCDDCLAAWKIEKSDICPDCEKKHAKCRCKPDILRGHVKNTLHLARYTKDESVTSKLILSLKDTNGKYLYSFVADELCELIKAGIKNYESYVVTYVPRSKAKKRKYGTDQAETLAREVAKRLNIRCIHVIKHITGKEQKKLTGAERLENAVSSYDLKKGSLLDICNRNIILLDDVMTTASSMYACASLLNLSGAASITCITVGKTYREKKKEEQEII